MPFPLSVLSLPFSLYPFLSSSLCTLSLHLPTLSFYPSLEEEEEEKEEEETSPAC